MSTTKKAKSHTRRVKSTVSKAKIAKVGTDTPAQLKAELNKTAYSSLITPAMLKSVNKTVIAIDKALAGERKFSVNIGGLLAQLKRGIISYLKESGGKVPKNSAVNAEFYNFVQVRFKIGQVRVREYIRLAERQDLHGFDLPASVLIELSRLKPEPLSEMIEQHPVSELKGLSFKDIKKLVKENNALSRKSTTKGPKAIKPDHIAKQLKSTFQVVRATFTNKPVDKEISSVIGEMSKWLIGRAS